MSPERKRIPRKKDNRNRHIILILLVSFAALFFLYREFGENEFFRGKAPANSDPAGVSSAWRTRDIPKVALVIDDLGPSRRAAEEVFNINVPFTLSVIPHEKYSRWIAKEGHSLGFEVIGHIPMEAKRPLELGRGGLYLRMADDEIIETLSGCIGALPHIRGISNHMGSAFTEDRRAMQPVLTVIREYGLFFLDSLTTAGSVAYELAEAQGVRTIQRDVFLDNRDEAGYIAGQWETLLRAAEDRGYAVGIAHPRRSTLDFFKKTLPSEKVRVVPLSELIELPT